MRLAILLLVAVGVPGIARAALPALEAAEREVQEGRLEPAIERYLEALEGLSSASPDQRQRVLRGLFSACRQAFQQEKLDVASHGLLGMLRPTRDEPLGPSFSAEVRSLLQEVAAGLLFLQQPRAAASALLALMEDSPGNAARWGLLVSAHLGTGELSRAEETLRHGLELYPDDPELLLAQGRLSQALAYRAVERASYGTAEAELRKAERELFAAAARHPREGKIRLALGGIRSSLLWFCSLTGQAEEANRLLLAAEEDLALAVHLDPRDPAPLWDLIQVLIVSGDWSEARGLLLRARAAIEERLQEGRERLGVQLSLRWMRHGLLRALDGANYRATLEDINLARIERAQARIRRALRDNPGFAGQAQRLRGLLSEREERLEREFERLRRLSSQRDRAVEEGDLWFRLQRFEQAEQRFRLALAAPPGGYSDDEIQARLEEVRWYDTPLRRVRLTIGSLDARLELPEGFDVESLAGALERAWARLGARLEQRLRGPLYLAVFPNRRALLEHQPPGCGPVCGGGEALGQVTLAADPRRGRRGWTDALLAGLTRRSVDEASFGHAPRWLSEGMVAWAVREWSAADEARLHELLGQGKVPERLRDLEAAFIEYWNEPEIMDILRLASEHLVRWLIERYGPGRLNVLLSVLRQRTSWEQALHGVFGLDVFGLAREWRESLSGPSYADPPSKRTK